VGEAWWDSRALFFCFAKEDWKLLDSGHRDISSIVAGK
jgi:hypothetical protein